MFYRNGLGKDLRLGDVVREIVCSFPKFSTVFFNGSQREYQISLTTSRYCVVLSPCCSIDGPVLALAPLKQITMRNAFLNPYFAYDLTNINRVVAPEKMYTPEEWELLSSEARMAKLSNAPTYTLVDYFVYAESSLFEEYSVRSKGGVTNNTRHYIVCFKDIFKIECPKETIAGAKVLELSAETRNELRNKIAHYYLRIPDEDKALLQSA